MLNLLPWQQQQWQQLLTARQNEKLAHALLLSGPRGIGLEQFAQILAASLLCSAPLKNSLPCGHCRACSLFETGNHPDIYWIEPEEEGKQIKVEQLREMIDFINLKSQYERYKIAVITPADNMNRSAANTLLKTLEEPPGSSLLVLISERPNLLPITIRSRCQQLVFRSVYDHTGVNWLREKIPADLSPEELLRIAGGAPLAALTLIEHGYLEKQKTIIADLDLLQMAQADPIKVAERWNGYGALEVLEWLLQMFRDMLRIRNSVEPAVFYPSEVLSCMRRLTNGLDLYRLMRCHDLVLKNYQLGTGQVSYNTQGLLEEFVIYWQSLANHPGGQRT